MAQSRWDPFEEIRKMQERMSRLLQEMEPRFEREKREAGAPFTAMPSVDIMDMDDTLIVTADIPGVEKEDIEISVRDTMLDIKAERKIEEEEREAGYVRHERTYNRYYRSIDLPSPVEEERAEATFKNGVLEVRLPKAPEARGKHVPIK